MKPPKMKGSSKRGVGEVIGNLIILMSSVVLATTVMFWGLSLQSGTQASYSEAIRQSNDQITEQLSIDEVYFNSGPPKSIKVYVRSFGDIPLRVVQIYVDGVAYTTTNTTIVARASAGVDTQYTGWTSGSTYIIRVATLRGNVYEQSFKAP